MQNEIIKRILKRIRQYDVIVIARHVSPDPDAICSQLALRDAILAMYPKKKVYAVGKSVSKFRKFGILDKVDVTTLNNALLITTDVPNFYRVDGIEGLKFDSVIKIDHHPFEEDFGGIEWIDESSSSVCQMIAVMILKSNFKCTESVASNLFLGIVSDSDRFLLPYTTPQTFQVCMELIRRYHLPFTKLYDKLYERPLEEVRFQGYISQNIEVSENGFAHIEFSDEILNEFHVDTATPSNLINSFNYIKEIYVWTFVTYDSKNHLYKVNIRSKGPVVNEIASKYHGGGHKFASGVRTETKEEVESLLRDLDEACKNYKSTLEM